MTGAPSANPGSGPDPGIVFDPHVVVALVAIAVALVIVLLLTTIPIADEPPRRRR